MNRLTCHRYGPDDDARAATVPHPERAGYLRARGWVSVRANVWTRRGDDAVTYSEAAAVREALREADR